MERFVIHHLSDLHIGPLRYSPERRVQVAPEAPHNLTFYREYLERLQRSSINLLPDIIIISGDLTSYASQDEMNTASDEIENMIKALQGKRSQWRDENDAPYVFIVPGNHDVDWQQDTYDDKIDKYARLATYLSKDGSVLSGVYRDEGRNVYWDFGDECNVFVYLLSSISLGGTTDPRIANIHKELAELHKSVASASGDKLSSVLEELHRLGRQDPGYVDEDDLRKMNMVAEEIPERRFKIAVMHHNPTSVPSGDIDAYDSIINAGSVKLKLFESKFDLVLHGHRHFLHTNHERLPHRNSTSAQGFFVIGADSLGCKPEAPFVKIDLIDANNAHGQNPPASIMSASEYRYNGTTYISPSNLLVEAVHRPIYAAVDKLIKNIGRQTFLTSRTELREAFDAVSPDLQTLRMEVLDYYEEQWVEDFHGRIGDYEHVFATDLQARSSLESPLYGKYLREQFSMRLRKVLQRTERRLYYSTRIYDAILCTGWMPEEALWGEYEIACGAPDQACDLEIVRVLLRSGPSTSKMDRWALENLDTDHRIAAAPLFVVDVDKVGVNSPGDFAIGLRGKNEILRCIQFRDGEIKPVTSRRPSYDLLRKFERLLENPYLQTIPQYLGRGWMISDPSRRRELAENYDRSRQTSELFLNKLQQQFQSLRERSRGVELGCGTGNYTLPMIKTFEHVVGLDVSQEMLSVAKNKPGSDHVEWICANALRSTLPTDYFDGVWGVSMLHYFRREQQRMLFREIFRILKPGGRVVIDIEFEEQHGSLWIVEFFPSLRKRYEGRILSQDLYTNWLKEIGFKSLEFEQFDLSPTDRDKSLRCGQHDANLYLKDDVLSNLPAFSEMPEEERLTGIYSLQQAIEDHSITEVMAKYIASMPGDIGVIIGEK